MENNLESFHSSSDSAYPTQSEEGITPSPSSKEDLTGKVQRLEMELMTLKENIQKRKGENIALKVLLYTGFSVLLIGFIYSNTTLQKVQLQSLEENVKIYQNQIQRNLLTVQEKLLQRSRNLVREELAAYKTETIKLKTGNLAGSRKTIVRSLLESVNQVVSRLIEDRPELQTKADEIRKQADQLLKGLEKPKTSLAETIPESSAQNR